ncbi:MAG: hypothetical protein AAGA56_19830 [Myxococcota bacterium]
MIEEHDEDPYPPPFDVEDFIEADLSDETERKRLFERAVPVVVRKVVERALETGVRNLYDAPENLREVINELKLPKEAAAYLYEQVDDTKKGVYRVVAKEIRDVLEHVNFADEIADVLTKLQFEVNTTVRFVPNHDRSEEHAPHDEEGATHGAGNETSEARKRPSRIPRPQVVSKVVMRARDALDRKPKNARDE